MEFEQNLTIMQFLVPAICTGLLAHGLVLYMYMAKKYRAQLYIAIGLNAVFGIFFVGSETMILAFGAWLHDPATAVQFHRIEQLGGAFFLFSVPFMLSSLLNISDRWKKINRYVYLSGLAIAVTMLVTAFAVPDLFISMTEPKPTWNVREADFGRGKEGIVYSIRDALLALLMAYSLFSIGLDIKKNRRVDELIYPLIGIVFAMFGGLNDIFYVYSGKNLDFLQKEYFSRFSIGVTLMILFFMVAAISKFIASTEELEHAHKIITASEQKYRFLVEGTKDCIFALDLKLNFISANKITYKQFDLSENNLKDKNFFDLLYDDPGHHRVAIDVIRNTVAQFLSTKNPVSFNAMFNIRNMREPQEFLVHFEHIEMDDKEEILVKASSISDDIVVRYVDFERARYVIENYLIAADEVTKKLVQSLPKFLGRQDINRLRIGLREIIINAIEHGNLNISFDEKTEALMKDEYFQFVGSRQKDDKYKNKRVTIEMSLSDEKIAYKIGDQGEGFDYKSFIDKTKLETDDAVLAHGRGITMAHNVFDEIKFNSRGNQVLLVKYLNRQNSA